MAIPNKQIGWSNEANLLWYIAKELEQIKGQLNRLPASPTTTTTTTSGVQNTIFKVSSMAETVCSQSPTLSLYYTAPLTDGSMLYTDQALTQQYNQFSYIADPVTGNIYAIINGLASFQFTCV